MDEKKLLADRLVALREATLDYRRAEARKDWKLATAAADRMISFAESDREMTDASYAFDRAWRMANPPFRWFSNPFAKKEASTHVG